MDWVDVRSCPIGNGTQTEPAVLQRVSVMCPRPLFRPPLLPNLVWLYDEGGVDSGSSFGVCLLRGGCKVSDRRSGNGKRGNQRRAREIDPSTHGKRSTTRTVIGQRRHARSPTQPPYRSRVRALNQLLMLHTTGHLTTP